jgi:predicted CXXCH cytochrome family protein
MTLPAAAFAMGEAAAGSSVDGTLNNNGCTWCHQGDPNTRRQGPHGGYTASTDSCAVCHTIHASNGTRLLFKATATASCLACHDGTGGYGVYGSIQARGLVAAASHRAVVPTTNVVPGGDPATGGARTETGFQGEGSFLGCIDCHSPHASNVVTPYNTERERQVSGWVDHYKVLSTNLLKQHPNGSDTTVTVYGSDWCAGCHRGRKSGGALHNHPVDSLAVRADAYSYDRVPLASWPGPVDLACDSSGNVYVTDPGNHRVQIFSSTGTYLGAITGGVGGALKEPRGVTVAGGYVYVSDSRSGYLSRGNAQVIGPSGRWSVMNPGSYAEAVAGLGTSPDGSKLAVTDLEGNSVRMLDATSTALLCSLVPVAGQQSPSPFPSSILGEFYAPSDAAVGPSGITYVVDSMNDRVERFDAAGVVISAFGTSGSGAGQFDHPLSVAVDASGRVYVADSGNHRIQRFSATGVYETAFGSVGSASGQFRFPRGVTVAPSGDIYVADSGNSRVERLSSAGAFLGQWGSEGSAAGSFSFDPAETGPMAFTNDRSLGQGDVFAGRGYVMQMPRTSAQAGHAPICQQCHEDSRNAGRLYDGIAVPGAFGSVPDGGLNNVWFTFSGPGSIGPRDKANPRFQNFPHETVNAKMLVETADDLCMNCHAPALLP